MKGFIKVKKAELVPDKYGKHIKISMVGIYDENGKWLKWIPLDEVLIEILLDNKIECLINESHL
jgi:hypothetical protein